MRALVGYVVVHVYPQIYWTAVILLSVDDVVAILLSLDDMVAILLSLHDAAVIRL